MTAAIATPSGGLSASIRAGWLLDAAAWLRLLDHAGLAGRHILILDKHQFPGASDLEADAFTSPLGVYDLVAPFVPRSRLLPGPVVFIDTAVVAGSLSHREPLEAVRVGRLIVNVIAMHEYAHAIDFEARGVKLPAGMTLDSIFAARVTATATRITHGATWLRAYCHLIYRSMATPAHRDSYLDFARVDVAGYGLGDIDDFFATLDADAAAAGLDAPLIEVVRSPAPTAFVELFNKRDAARSASKETTHATAA